MHNYLYSKPYYTITRLSSSQSTGLSSRERANKTTNDAPKNNSNFLCTHFCLIPILLVLATASLNSCGNNASDHQQAKKEDATPATSATSATFVSPKAPDIKVDLITLKNEGSLPDAEEVHIAYDHAFKTSKNYKAYDLLKVLKPYLEELKLDSTSDAIVTFVCVDGYKPTQKLSDIFAHEGHIAFKDLDVKESGKNWMDEDRAKFAPFYLVWKDIPYEERKMVWPYALIGFEIRKHNTIYSAIIPQNNIVALEGFQYFESYCIKCHPVNKVGGNLGPDLNFPKSILDYWELEHIYAFSKDPQSYRYNSKMHPIEPMTREEFDKIVVYLEYMKGVKLTID